MSGVIRSIIVIVAMFVVATMGGGPLHLGAYVAAGLMGAVLGNWLAAEPEARYGWLKALGVALAVSASGLGMMRDALDLDEKALIAIVVCATGLYMGAYLRFLSHPQVEILQDS